MAGRDLIPYDREKLKRDQAQVERRFWDKMRRYIRRVPFIGDAVAGYYCAIDPATPLQVKAVLFGALAYFVLPIDIVPDVVAWLGFTDDAAVLYAAIRTVAPHIKPHHRALAKTAIERLAGDASTAQRA